MEFKNKNIYFIDSDTPIETSVIAKRIKQLKANQVNATNKEIDFLIYDQKIEHDPKIENRFKRLQKKGITVLSPLELINEMGFDPNPAYIEWNPYPNYDPWTGEKISLWH